MQEGVGPTCSAAQLIQHFGPDEVRIWIIYGWHFWRRPNCSWHAE